MERAAQSEDADAASPADAATSAERAATEPLGMTFGTAVGAAMLGLEQALRSEPPAEVIAAEHAPERGRTGNDAGLIIDIPELPATD